jgi:energy-coupling factor transporter ATP-binding protein EcfA2
MRITKINVKNLFGIKEMELDGKNVLLQGKKGTGKTSLLDAVRYGLKNESNRDYIVKQGADEGEILIETDADLSLQRRKRESKADYKSVKQNGKAVDKPETFLKGIFTELQLNPVEFLFKSKREQNDAIFDLISFDWDIEWIREKFGDVPQVNYEQNILKVLNDIQAENGPYFKARQDVNRDIRNKKAFLDDLAKDVPDGYNHLKWKEYDIGQDYDRLNKATEDNSKIDKAKAFKQNFENQKKALESEKDKNISVIEQERESNINKMNLEIEELKKKIALLENSIESEKKLSSQKANEVITKYETEVNKMNQLSLRADERIEKNGYQDLEEIKKEIEQVKAMKEVVPTFDRALKLEEEVNVLTKESEEFTRKIELARDLPSQILEDCDLPIKGLSIKDGIALINGLPVSNLSDGEKLDLCVEIASIGIDTLKVILIDGCEKLDKESQNHLFNSCRRKGLQIIATQTTNDNELKIIYL